MRYSNQLVLAAAVACLASIASAKPIQQHQPRGYIECPRGSFYIKCWNNHAIEGCFTKYPCDESSSSGSPTQPTQSDSCEDDDDDQVEKEEQAEQEEDVESTTCTPGRAMIPDLYTLFPGDTSKTSVAQTRFEIRNKTGETILEQAAHFKLPAGARDCSLGWMMNVIGERTFEVTGSGLFRFTPFNDFPTAGVSWASVEPLVAAANRTSSNGDMTFWDQPEFNTARNHSLGGIQCRPDVYLKLQLSTLNGEGHVIMDQDATNGFFIDYKC